MPLPSDPKLGQFADFKLATPVPPKLVVYSGHDTTLTPLTAALGIPLVSWPPYSSHIELELWKSKALNESVSADMMSAHATKHLLTDQHRVDTIHPLAPIDSTVLAHIKTTSAVKTFKDPYWVRVMFNGTAVVAMPLTVFQEKIKYMRAGSAETREGRCGPVDPTLKPFTWI